jgi:hypothetical protein
MKSIKKSIAWLIIVLSLAGCTSCLRETRDWAFIQSVGGISIGQPVNTQDGWYLPVNCDVSGLRTITTKPTQLNSALVCQRVLTSEDGDTLFISVQTSVVDGKLETPSCRAVNIGNLKRGRYSIKYKDPNGTSHEIGSIEL